MRDANGRSYEELCALAEALRGQSRLTESLRAKEDALSLLIKEYGPFHPQTLSDSLAYARLLYDESMFKEALELTIQTKESIERALTEHHPLLPQSYRIIALIYQAQELFFEASLILKKEIELRKHISERTNESLVDAFDLLATVYKESGDDEEHQVQLRNALELVNHDPGFPPTRIVDLALRLGMSYQESNMVTESIRCFELTLQKLHSLEDTDRSKSIECSLKLAELYGEMEDWEQRERSLRVALQEMTAQKTSDDLSLELYYAVVHHYQEGRGLSLCLQDITEAFHSIESSVSPGSREHVDTLAALGECCYLAGEYEQAQTVLESALKVLQENTHLSNEKRAEILHNLGTAYVATNRLKDAEQCFQETVTLHASDDSQAMVARAYSLYALGTVEKMMGEAHKALSHLQECHTARLSALGDTHPLTKQASEAIARIKEPKQEQASQSSTTSAAYSISHTAAEFNTALLLMNEQNFREAHALLEKILHVLERQLGTEHSDLIPVLEQLVTVQSKLGREEEARTYAQRAATIER